MAKKVAFIKIVTNECEAIENINYACLSDDAKINLFGELYFCNSVTYDDDFIMTAILIREG